MRKVLAIFMKNFIPQTLGGSKYNVYNRLFGWPMYRSTCNYFNSLFSEIRPQRIMEIGVCRGDGTKRMVKAAKKSGIKNVEYYGFDIFGSPPISEPNPKGEIGDIERVKKILSRLDCKYRLYEGNTKETLPREVPTLPKMDFIYIDGGHSYETVKSDWKNAEKLMHPNTVVVFDDYGSEKVPSVTRAVDEINNHNVEIIPFYQNLKHAIVRRGV